MTLGRLKLDPILPLGFIACYVVSALLAQWSSDIPPWMEQAPIEYFTGGLLWMTSRLCLLLALHPQRGRVSPYFWLAGCVVLAVLAIDEAMAGHEWVEKNYSLNDDFPKILLWLATAKILHVIYLSAAPYTALKYIFIFGFLFQTSYLAFELSDGEFFAVPERFGQVTAKWGEELSELFFLSAYWLGFFLVYRKVAELGGDNMPSRVKSGGRSLPLSDSRGMPAD